MQSRLRTRIDELPSVWRLLLSPARVPAYDYGV
jgi:hypothetical protein